MCEVLCTRARPRRWRENVIPEGPKEEKTHI
jgi:hypothetical protein